MFLYPEVQHLHDLLSVNNSSCAAAPGMFKRNNITISKILLDIEIISFEGTQ